MRNRSFVSRAVRLAGAALWLLLFAFLAAAQVRESLPVPDVAGYKTLKCDFHMHTVVSDGDVWPTTRVNDAWRDGLDVISITDHADYHPHSADVTTDCARPYTLARPLAERLGILLIPGIEVSEGDIHFNALFVTDANALKGLKLLESLDRARKQDAFAFWNHPGWKQTPEWFPLVAEAHSKKLFQGMELVNGGTFYPEAYPWVESRSLSIIANSDVHSPMPPGQGGRIRPITLVFASSKDSAGVREALFARRTAAWMGGEVWGPENLVAGLWQGAVKVENPAIALQPGSGRAVLLENESAIPFRVRVQRAPEWLRVSGGELRALGAMGLAVTAAKTAPAGEHRVEVELEISNVHTEPGKNLVVRLPLTVRVNQ